MGRFDVIRRSLAGRLEALLSAGGSRLLDPSIGLFAGEPELALQALGVGPRDRRLGVVRSRRCLGSDPLDLVADPLLGLRLELDHLPAQPLGRGFAGLRLDLVALGGQPIGALVGLLRSCLGVAQATCHLLELGLRVALDLLEVPFEGKDLVMGSHLRRLRGLDRGALDPFAGVGIAFPAGSASASALAAGGASARARRTSNSSDGGSSTSSHLLAGRLVLDRGSAARADRRRRGPIGGSGVRLERPGRRRPGAGLGDLLPIPGVVGTRFRRAARRALARRV